MTERVLFSFTEYPDGTLAVMQFIGGDDRSLLSDFSNELQTRDPALYAKLTRYVNDMDSNENLFVSIRGKNNAWTGSFLDSEYDQFYLINVIEISNTNFFLLFKNGECIKLEE